MTFKAKLLIGAIAIGVATPALAQDVTGTVTVNGSVAPKCLFTTPSETITIPELAGADGKLDPATVNTNATLVGWCNGTASSMKVQAEPLLNTTPNANPLFDNRVDFTATAAAGTPTATDSSVGALSYGTPTTIGLYSGNIPVTLSAATSPNAGLLIAGAYQGHVLVTLSPAITPPAP